MLPVKWNKVKNREADDVQCVMCGRHTETIKHLLCSCTDQIVKDLKTVRHNKIVSELALWGTIATEKEKIKAVEVNPKLDSTEHKVPDLLFTYKRHGKTHQVFVEVTIAMDNATQ